MNEEIEKILASYNKLWSSEPRYSTSAVVNWFIQKAIKDKKRKKIKITPMKMQKLVYFAHAWFLGKEKITLVNEPVQAWKFGPVFPSIYNRYKYFGQELIPLSETSFMQEYEEDEGREVYYTVGEESTELLEEVWGAYAEQSALTLSNWTHQENSPWDIVWHRLAREGMIMGVVIPDELIKLYFSEKLKNKELY